MAAHKAFADQIGKGRPKGSVNKNTRLAKDAIAATAEGLGGVERMIAWAKESPDNERVFWQSIYTKLVPVQTELTGANGGPIKTLDVGKLDETVLRALAAAPVIGETLQ